MIVSIPKRARNLCLSVSCGMIAHVGKFCGFCKQKGNDKQYRLSQLEGILKDIEKEKERLRMKFRNKDNYFRNMMDEEAYIVDIDISTKVTRLYERADRIIWELRVDK